jgi:hypothetical protein
VAEEDFHADRRRNGLRAAVKGKPGIGLVICRWSRVDREPHQVESASLPSGLLQSCIKPPTAKPSALVARGANTMPRSSNSHTHANFEFAQKLSSNGPIDESAGRASSFVREFCGFISLISENLGVERGSYRTACRLLSVVSLAFSPALSP